MKTLANRLDPAQGGARADSGRPTMTVRSILDAKGHQVMSVAPGAKLSAAVKLLGERKIGAVLVMEQGRMEGVLSERDIVRVLSERGAGALDEPVSAVMTRKVVSCRESDTVSGIMEMMTTGKFRPSSCRRGRQGGRADLDRRHRQAARGGI
ncbi:CBS domain-containing protein [Bradyrhizobium elkanii]